MIYQDAFFDAGLNRLGTDCVKWDACRREHGEDALPMWVADMDFESPREVAEAIRRRAAHPTFGYTEVTDADIDALRGFWARRHGLDFAREDVVLMPCVVTGLKAAIRALTQRGDGVIIQSPVYGPFRFSVETTGRRVMDAPLLHSADGSYGMDLEAVEARCREGARLMMLCSPHNPVSRLWSRGELEALLALLNRYGVPLVSDEIHADFVYRPARFTPVLALQRERTVSLCAPSKTFNLAGLQTAFAVCADEAIRKPLAETLESCGAVSGNIFGLTAARAAFSEGDAWLDALLRYLDGNRRELAAQVAAKLPGAVLTPIEATYLGWIDLRAWGLDSAELGRRCEKAGIILTHGPFFGRGGDGFVRINLGCPRRHIAEAVDRLSRARDL